MPYILPPPPLPQSLHAMEGHVMVNFLPTILNQLFCVLTRATHEDVAVNVTRQAEHKRLNTRVRDAWFPAAESYVSGRYFWSLLRKKRKRKL